MEWRLLTTVFGRLALAGDRPLNYSLGREALAKSARYPIAGEGGCRYCRGKPPRRIERPHRKEFRTFLDLDHAKRTVAKQPRLTGFYAFLMDLHCKRGLKFFETQLSYHDRRYS
jgi:hypothetical protein